LQLYATNDFARTWLKVAEHIQQASWGNINDVYVEVLLVGCSCFGAHISPLGHQRTPFTWWIGMRYLNILTTMENLLAPF
jgi:hypothetical protein